MRISTRALAEGSARHPWRVFGLWVAVIAVALVVQSFWFGEALTQDLRFSSDPDSQVGQDLLIERLTGPTLRNEVVIVRSSQHTVDDDAFAERVASLAASIVELGPPSSDSVLTYYNTGSDAFVSADRRSTLIQFQLGGSIDETIGEVGPIYDHVIATSGEGGFEHFMLGESSFNHETAEISNQELQRGESVGIPIALLILLVLFGSVTAALLPIVFAVVAIVVTLGVVAVIGQVEPLVSTIMLTLIMIGLAVGIDYSLIIISRFREELESGKDTIAALAMTGDTASRTVFFSGMTVVLALVGMLLVPLNIFQAVGLGPILVVLVAVLAALTLLPAVLSLLGPRVNSLRIPFVGRRPRERASGPERSNGGFWGVVTRVVMRYPVPSLVLAGGLLVAATVPALGLDVGFNGFSSLKSDLQSRQAYDILERDFSGGTGSVTPTKIVVDGDVNDPAVAAAVERLAATLEAAQGFVRPSFQANAAGDLGLLTVQSAGDAYTDESVERITLLRNAYIPEAFAGVDAEVYVAGESAFSKDFFSMVESATPWVFAFVLGMSFVLLMVAFRSIVVPLKAILLNLLSVGASYGMLVLVFVHGWGEPLGLQQTDIVEAWLPLFLFCILFGLSMDYHVFLLSRVRERFSITRDNTDAVAYGLRSTGGLITGAALIMVAVFSGFAAGQFVSTQQMGFGLAFAIFIDATIVRSVLVPATMQLLGERNWYFPRFLQWVPRIGIEGAAFDAGPPPSHVEP
ncbi:MAG: MMPL family transporter [Chloroflexota bacterium]|nr:MMPL family transporter [Chloroflexota bacterium]